MADKVSESITINASPKKVMEVIADLAAYPDWSDGFTAVEIVNTHDDGAPKDASFTISTPLGKDTYEIGYVWKGHESVRWTLNSDEDGKPKSSMMRSLDGIYKLTPEGKGTKVTYELEVDPKIPMIGFLKKKAASSIVDQALKGLKKRVEQG